jgi:hypothetical protein
MLGTALIGAQAGHLIAYQLRFGGAAMQVQSTGSHEYFLAAAKTGFGIAAMVVLGLLLVIGAGRALSGRRLEADSAAPFVRTLAAVYTIQLSCFVVQETAEAMAGGGHLGSAPALLLWGAIGQLPVAVVVALTLRWLAARVGPALAAIRLASAITIEEFAWVPSSPTLRFAIATSVARRDVLAAGFSRRGPPLSS